MLLSVWVSGYSIYSHCQLRTLTPVQVNHQISPQVSHSQPRVWNILPLKCLVPHMVRTLAEKRTSQVSVLTKHCHGHHRDGCGEYMGESSDNIWWWWYFEQTATVEEGGGVESRHGVGQINMGGGERKEPHHIHDGNYSQFDFAPSHRQFEKTQLRKSKERHWTDINI